MLGRMLVSILIPDSRDGVGKGGPGVLTDKNSDMDGARARVCDSQVLHLYTGAVDRGGDPEGGQDA